MSIATSFYRFYIQVCTHQGGMRERPFLDCRLAWWGGLCISMSLSAYPGGAQFPVGSPTAGKVER